MNSTKLNRKMKKIETFGKARIRQFMKEDKLQIFAEADQAQGTGKIHEILRREGFYSSQLSDWHRKRAKGEFGPGTDSTEQGKKGHQRKMPPGKFVSFVGKWLTSKRNSAKPK